MPYFIHIDNVLPLHLSTSADGLWVALKPILNLNPIHSCFWSFFLQFISREYVLNFNTIHSLYRGPSIQ